jgi:membrane fusion protein (multidrug efflux system)
MKFSVCATLLIGALAIPASAQQPATIPVGTVKAERKPIAETKDFVGRIEAVNRVQVVARVTGYLEAILFKEGDLIKEGAPLYRIEKGLFQAAAEETEGMFKRTKAEKAYSAAQLQRMETLVQTKAVAVTERDRALADDQKAEGAILVAEANMHTAQINLGYTDIVSPIAGKVGRSAITKGNVVGPSSGTLTIIVSQDPMYVTFPVSQRELLRAQERGRQVDVKNIKVRLRFADGRDYDQSGKIDFVDVTVDRTTDTVLVRAVFPNPTFGLIDGQLVRVNLEAGIAEEKVVIPQSALIADQEGVYVFVVDNGKAAVRRVKTAGENGTGVVIDSGLSGGEQVIVEGLQGVRPGASVRASPMPEMPGRS